MNKVIQLGNLTKKVELRETTGDNKTLVARGTIAVNEKRGNKESTLFLNFVAFGKTAEVLDKYTDKGSKVLLEGSLEQNNYENKDGVKVYNFQMVVDRVKLLDSKKDSSFNTEEY